MPRTALRILTICFACVAAAPAAAQAADLSKSRYDRLDKVYTEFIRLDKAKPTSGDFTAIGASCRALGTSDPLLRAMRTDCLTTLTVLRDTIAFGSCTSASNCASRADKVRRGVVKAIKVARASNKAIDGEVQAADCRKALRTSAKDLRDGEKLASALKDFAAAIRRGSQEGAQRALERIQSISSDATTGKADRAEFRKACG